MQDDLFSSTSSYSDKIFQVSEFNEFINTYLDSVGQVVIEGEISELKLSQNKWVFGSIKDEKASVDIFGAVFQIKNIAQLSEGMLVKVYGTPRLYEKTGRFSVSVTQIIPSGEGALRQAFERLKRQLDSEGLFDVARKRSITQFPERIGLITAKGSQAYNDFVKIIGERMGGISITFVPVTVQGVNSPRSVTEAIHFLNTAYPTLDCMVITRGGGSLEDLIGFNDESVARAIFGSKIPVVSAVGHEGDWSLADLVADVRASTPSNAAELIVRDRREVLRTVDHMVESIEMSLEKIIVKAHADIKPIFNRLSEVVWKQITDKRARIDSFERHVDQFIALVQRQDQRVDSLYRLLTSLDPRSVLKRGFSITYNPDGKVVRSTHHVALNSMIKTVLVDGAVESQITVIE